MFFLIYIDVLEWRRKGNLGRETKKGGRPEETELKVKGEVNFQNTFGRKKMGEMKK